MKLTYRYEFADRDTIEYELVFDPDNFLLETPPTKELPGWTALEFQQCPNCTLSTDQCSRCPVAVNLVPIIEDWSDIVSYSGVKVTFVNPERTLIADTTAQKALSSLLGLVMATSAWPHMTFFRPMAYFHRPVVSQDETLVRVTSNYLLVQYFLSQDKDQHSFKLERLGRFYEDIRLVNESLCKRMRALNTADASSNALVILHLLSCTLPMSFDKSLEQVRKLFEPVIAMLHDQMLNETE